MTTHAKLSPSSAKRWRSCTASVKASAGITDNGSAAARLGTAKHLVAGDALEANVNAIEFLGRTVLFCVDAENKRVEGWAEGINRDAVRVEHEIVIDDEAVAECQSFIDFVRDLVTTTGGMLLVEQKVNIGQITGEEGATGTSDVVILAGDELIVVDAKFGQGKVTAYETL